MNELNQNDLTNLLAIIDMATQRGVFKGSDLAAVGQLYEKIKTLIQDPAQSVPPVPTKQ